MGSQITGQGGPVHCGGCICGQARYSVQAPPLIVHCCHCSWCQRESGSSFVINALLEIDRVELLAGAVERVHTPSHSGQGQDIVRCTGCHVALWSHYAFAGIGQQVAFVRVGTLDTPAAMPPDVHIFTEEKPAWLALTGEARQFPGYYRAREVWSKASLARKAALQKSRAGV